MHVRMNHANGIVDCLYVVKRNPILCQDFVEHNGLPIVVELLRSQNSTILNLSLSVLADVCTLSNARYKVRPPFIFVPKISKFNRSKSRIIPLVPGP